MSDTSQLEDSQQNIHNFNYDQEHSQSQSQSQDSKQSNRLSDAHSNIFQEQSINNNNTPHGQIAYMEDPEDYLKKITHVIDSRVKFNNTWKEKNDSRRSQCDDQVQGIINEVLNKRRRISRMSKLEQSIIESQDQLQPKTKKKKPSFLNIEEINHRLAKENQQLMKTIKNLTHKINKLGAFRKPSNHSQASHNLSGSHSRSLMEERGKQLEKLKKRLENAEKANSRMQKQLTKINSSRRTTKPHKPNKSPTPSNPNQSSSYKPHPANINNPHPPNSSTNSPNKNNLYSPIMQFQQYSLKNDPHISQYEPNLQKTSQFGFNLVMIQEEEGKKQFVEACVQVDLGGKQEQEEREWESQELGRRIRELEIMVFRNNEKISKYESLSMKKT